METDKSLLRVARHQLRRKSGHGCFLFQLFSHVVAIVTRCHGNIRGICVGDGVADDVGDGERGVSLNEGRCCFRVVIGD